MAHIEQGNTAQLDLAGQEADTLPRESGPTGDNGVEGKAIDEAVGTRSAGDNEEGKEAKHVPPKLSPASPPTMSASDESHIPDPQTIPSLLLSPPAAAVATISNRPPLIQHSSSQSHSGSSTPTTTTPSHPKKFSSININKKFLEKTTSASAATNAVATASSASKTTGNGISRPPTQTSSPHPRLVTTKLTATAPSPSSVAGWSRPSSTAPPASVTGVNSPNSTAPTSSAPAATPSTAPTTTVPQLPHPSKVIQPVPRSALAHQQATPSTGPSKEGSSNAPSGSHNKPAWGNVKPPSTTVSRPDVTANDFPTAAEVAQGAVICAQGTTNTRKNKPTDQPTQEAPATSSPTTTKPSRNEEADTFRGVHLDPNAHHWDEMVEDDDNYWDNVIEFGDGRRYKVEVAESRSREPSPPASIKSSQSMHLEPDTPVSKEERFAEDFDRSWPSGPRRGPSTSTQQRSPQEPPRVLFNERSNKLEPYSSHRAGHGAFPGKRGSYQDRTVSPTEPKSASSAFYGLSKGSSGSPDFGSTRSRRFSSASSSSFIPPSDRDRPRDRDRRDGIPSSPRIPKDVNGLPGRPSSLRGRERDSERDFSSFDRDRHSTMGPPPIPGQTWRNTSRESVRQRVPSSGSVNGAAPPRRHPPQDEPSESLGSPSVARGPPHSPALSHASLSTRAPMMSPATSPLALPALVGHDLEELKKDVMHNAAARAKQRRQQEEEEREAQKERARKKAAELEAKMKAEAEEKAQKGKEAGQAKKEQEQLETRQGDVDKVRSTLTMMLRDMLNVLQDIEAGPATIEVLGVAEKTRQDASSTEVQRQPLTLKPLQRPPSEPPPQHSGDSESSRRVIPTAGPSNDTPSVAETAETWRRTTPLPGQPDELQSKQRHLSNPISFMPPPPLDHIQTLMDGKQDLEVVDFTDMGRFVGETIIASTTEEKEISRKTSRPVASDFFDDAPSSSLYSQSLSPSAKDDIDTWRRKTPLNQSPTSEQQIKGVPGKDRPEAGGVTDSAEQTHRANETLDGRHPSRVSSPSTQRPLRPQNSYHQAPMSSLVDAMSRIKGAMNDARAEESNRENHLSEAEIPSTQSTQSLAVPPTKPKERWVAPSLRVRMSYFQEENMEEHYRTAAEPPPSPKPSWGGPTVKLPSKSQHREPVHRRQLYYFSRPPPPVRWDILSFDPPIEGMIKRNLSVNDVLFRPFGGYKNKTRYRIQLPRSKPRSQNAGQNSSKNNSFGGFGKQNGADSSTSWRKTISPLPPPPGVGDEQRVEVNTTSRSPPPEPEYSSPTLAINLKTDTSPIENSAPLPRVRSQPRMPEGSGVAFYREPEAEPKMLVNFIVSSEIDVPQSPHSQTSKEDVVAGTSINDPAEATQEPNPEKATGNPSPKSGTDGVKGGKVASPTIDSEIARSPDTKKSEKSSHQSSPWVASRSLSVKESPARAPDPDHLRAVWSQTSDKAGLHTINSLKGIADDLTALPFTIQDVKSEDGGTPPPPPGISSSRISLHDVTRAFQQVPSSSSSAPHKPSISPPSTTAPVARPPPSNYPYPTPPNNMRPTYAAYPSPMMSHSPSPTMIYPHMVSSPVPARIQTNGHAPMYNPPMWVPVHPPAQVSNGMMRPIGPMASPYAPPLMAYSSNGAPAMYAPAMPGNMPGTPQAQNMQASRNRNMPTVSPVMQHAGAHMYPASPAMMHMQMTPTTGYMPLPGGRGQPRPENGQTGMHQSNSSHPPSGQVGFTPVPPSPFMRNW
ncbi:hypothetical protein AX15_005651 [Amanita polypyramis BW_CC]|nr:hypothetical protein AX15_005651 [Amanita polypyramis BW_CC]